VLPLLPILLANSSLGGRARQTNGIWGGLVSGMDLGLAWTPCVGPIMASVITLAINHETTLSSAAMTFAFSIGSAVPMAGFIIADRSLTGWER